MGNAGSEKATEMTKEKFDQLINIIGLDSLIVRNLIITGEDNLTKELSLFRKAIKRFEENTKYEVSVAVKGKQIC